LIPTFQDPLLSTAAVMTSGQSIQLTTDALLQPSQSMFQATATNQLTTLWTPTLPQPATSTLAETLALDTYNVVEVLNTSPTTIHR
jgi:hypothetical protein